MLNKLLNKREEQGFTIIEVLIVLAIAALILLIVFLAVPALQRNSRNTSRQRDAADVLASVNEYIGDNSGSLPSTCSGTASIVWGAGTTTTTSMGYYKGGTTPTACAASALQPTLTAASTGVAYLVTAPTAYAAVTQDSLEVVEQASCAAAGVPQAGSSRQFVALYWIENGPSTNTPQCLSS